MHEVVDLNYDGVNNLLNIVVNQGGECYNYTSTVSLSVGDKCYNYTSTVSLSNPGPRKIQNIGGFGGSVV